MVQLKKHPGPLFAGQAGDCAIGTLNCDMAAVIDVRDGDVRIDGLDGRASILKHRRGASVSGRGPHHDRC